MSEIRDVKDKAPNQDLIRHLEKLLAYAKSGEVRSLLYVAGWDDDGVDHSWVIDARNGPARLLGEVQLLLADTTTLVQLQRGQSVLIDRLREYLPL